MRPVSVEVKRSSRAGRTSRGADLYAWHARVKPIGLPLAFVAAGVSYRRNRSLLRALAAACAVVGAAYVAGRFEFGVRRREWRRRRVRQPACESGGAGRVQR